VHKLAARDMPATAEEMMQMNNEEEDEAFSQAIDTVLATTRAGRKRTATSKVVDNVEQARQSNIPETGGRGGRGGVRGGPGHGGKV
jgi:hypothetical protein